MKLPLYLKFLDEDIIKKKKDDGSYCFSERGNETVRKSEGERERDRRQRHDLFFAYLCAQGLSRLCALTGAGGCNPQPRHIQMMLSPTEYPAGADDIA